MLCGRGIATSDISLVIGGGKKKNKINHALVIFNGETFQ